MRHVFRPTPRPQAQANPTPRSTPATLIALGASAVLLVSACSGSSSSGSSSNSTGTGGGSSSGAATAGGSASFALPPNATPNWIFPIGTPGHLASYNSSISAEMYLPLYNYDTSSGTLGLDESISAAQAPVYSNGDKTVTITLRNLTWSNGKPVTSRDVQFWVNLVQADKAQWGAYSPGQLPDNVASFTIVSPSVFRLQLTHAYNPGWFTGNELSLITPLPQAAWDIESSGGPVGNYDLTTAGAKKVFAYLTGASGQLASYDSSPLWKVTDGQFSLQSWATGGTVVLAKSKTYNGAGPARLSTVTFLPFTSDEAEFNVLRSGGVDYGYIPITDLSQEKLLESEGYRVSPWVGWAISYIPYNFNNPAMGAVFKQLYVRQALQMAVDQKTIANDIWDGEAAVGYGPVPQVPVSSYLSSTQENNPYPYSLSAAKALLTSHGWTVPANGTATCTSPGSGASQCGPGVAGGAKLQFTVISESGSTETTNMMQELQSSFSQIGATLSVRQAPLNTVLNDSAICKPSQAACSWQMSFFGTQGSWYFPAYPSGEQLFSTSAGVNLGSYSSPAADSLISQTNLSGSPSTMQAYSAYLAKNLPVIWLPNPDYQVSAIKNTLHGVLQNPLASMNPQQWYLTR
jgi:peptide/nickel transport system substrate-binding protein